MFIKIKANDTDYPDKKRGFFMKKHLKFWLLVVRTYTIKVVPGENKNYEVVPVNGTLSISQKTVTVTPKNEEITYGDPIPAPSAEATGVLEGEQVNYGLMYEKELFAAGKYGINILFKDNLNYQLTYVGGELTTRALQFSAGLLSVCILIQAVCLQYNETGDLV